MMNRTTQNIGSAIDALFGSISHAVAGLSSNKKNVEYHSDFAKPSQVGLSRWNHGYTLDGVHALTKKASFSNAAVFGASGAGKGASVLIPSIFSLARGRSSMVIHDISDETFPKVAGYLATRGYRLVKYDFSDPSRSEKFSWLALCHKASDIKKGVHVDIRNALGDAKGEVFWNTSSELLYAMFGTYLVKYAAPEYRNTANVLRLLEAFNGDPEKVDRLFVATGDEGLISNYKSSVAMGDRTLASCIANTRAALSLWLDEAVVQTTSSNTFNFEELRSSSEPIAVFISTPLKDAMYYRPLSAQFFENLFNSILTKLPKPGDRGIFILLDEASSFRFSALSSVISNIRKYNASIMLLLQDYQALVAQYGSSEAHNIRSNCYAQVYLPGQNIDSCKELEATLGKFSFKDEKGIARTRSLMSADEIRTSDCSLILLGNNPPVKVKPRRYFESPWFNYLSNIPPYEIPVKPVVDPPMLPIG